MKKVFLIGIILILGISTYYGRTIYKQEEVKSLILYGNIEIRQVDLSFRVSGRIKSMYFEEGDIAQKDDLLAELDDTPYKIVVDKTTAEIAQNQALYNNAVSKYKRNKPLCEKSIVSQQECDDIFNNMNGTKAGLEASQAANKQALNDLKDTQMYAPDTGIIMTRIQEPGAVVNAAQAIYTMSKDNPIWIRAYIPEPQLGNVKYGTKATIHTDSIDPQTQQKRTYDGYVGYISPVAEFTPKTVETSELRTDLVYRIRVYINNSDEYLKQGMPATVEILIQ